jgi:hypothetical protein
LHVPDQRERLEPNRLRRADETATTFETVPKVPKVESFAKLSPGVTEPVTLLPTQQFRNSSLVCVSVILLGNNQVHVHKVKKKIHKKYRSHVAGA